MDDIDAVGKENVLIQAGDCVLTLLPALGGKIASIRMRETELLQRPLAPYAPRTRSMSFDAGDASGWDECMPSVAACQAETEQGPVLIPDHGDLWRVAWEEANQPSETIPGRPESSNGQLTLRGKCFSLPLRLKRTIALMETAAGWKLQLDYTVSNTGNGPAPWSWVAHPLFAVEPGDRIVLPSTIKEMRLEGSGAGRLGKKGDRLKWPIAMLADGGSTDLSMVQEPEAKIGDKLFAGPMSKHENWCALERRCAKLRIKLTFDVESTPYLGLWICYGGWPDAEGPKQMCVALEPSTAPVDSLAETGPWSRVLKPGESYSWPMTVEIEII